MQALFPLAHVPLVVLFLPSNNLKFGSQDKGPNCMALKCIICFCCTLQVSTLWRGRHPSRARSTLCLSAHHRPAAGPPSEATKQHRQAVCKCGLWTMDNGIPSIYRRHREPSNTNTASYQVRCFFTVPVLHRTAKPIPICH